MLECLCLFDWGAFPTRPNTMRWPAADGQVRWRARLWSAILTYDKSRQTNWNVSSIPPRAKQLPSMIDLQSVGVTLWYLVYIFMTWEYFGFSPLPEIGTTRIITCLVEESYKFKPSFPTITQKGDNPKYTVSSCIRAVGLPNLHTGRPHLRRIQPLSKKWAAYAWPAMVVEAAPQLCCVFVRCWSASCMLQVRFNLTWWDPGLLHPSIPKRLSRYLLPNAKTHLHGRNYSVYSLHNIVILGTFVRCKQNLFGTTCFFILPGWNAVVPDCWRRCATWFHSLFLMSFWSSGGSTTLNSSRF